MNQLNNDVKMGITIIVQGSWNIFDYYIVPVAVVAVRPVKSNLANVDTVRLLSTFCALSLFVAAFPHPQPSIPKKTTTQNDPRETADDKCPF